MKGARGSGMEMADGSLGGERGEEGVGGERQRDGRGSPERGHGRGRGRMRREREPKWKRVDKRGDKRATVEGARVQRHYRMSPAWPRERGREGGGVLRVKRREPSRHAEAGKRDRAEKGEGRGG